MAPLKFEDNIKDKLEQRTIQPSDAIWERLDQELDAKSGQKKVKKYWWMGLAASIVGVLMTTTFFTNSSDSLKPSNNQLVEVTNEKNDSKQSEDIDVVNIDALKEEEIIVNKETTEAIEKEINTPITKKNKEERIQNKKSLRSTIATIESVQKVEENSEEDTKIVITEKSEVITHPIKEIEDPLEINKGVIDNKVSGIVAQVEQLEQNNKVVTDEEIEALLLKAQHEITTQQILQSNTVNASALLLDVESELDESFKDRVFEALKTGFEKLKTTVAERDN
ncbi:hypothetical protein [uncultured Aquimarina sp.]|uniref:hypothetical protein n=1 Tax=uncultured Aquimarina sp. TaxID=575652 RepID=UPI0026386137|nr:hypothetical protein [uncultured Aquimarina sp.]